MALLLTSSAAVDARDRTGETALHKAATEGSEECVRHLVRAGADVNAASSAGATPLHLAAKLRHERAASELLRRWPSTLVVETLSPELAELMRSHSRLRLLAEDSVEGAIKAVCLPLVSRCSVEASVWIMLCVLFASRRCSCIHAPSSLGLT